MAVEIITVMNIPAKSSSLTVIIDAVTLTEFDYNNGMVSSAARPEGVLSYADFRNAFTALRVWMFDVQSAMNPSVTPLVAYHTNGTFAVSVLLV